ncbi:MAG: antitoxin [Spirochaetota bacterium]
MRSPEDYRHLAGELLVDIALLEQLLGKHAKASERAELAGSDELAWAAVGYTIHNIYCLFENYFLRISKFFGNGLDAGSWHAELIEGMCLELPGTRPRLFDRSFAERMDAFRRFRHAFRNMYQTELDPRRVRILNEDLPVLVADFLPWHQRFIEALDRIADEAENPEA